MKPARKPRKCSNCGSKRIAEILYGDPAFSDELQRDIELGKIVLGGCVIGENDPIWQCADCGRSFPQPLAEQVILELGYEGGSATIFGNHSTEGGWKFYLERDERTMEDFVPEEEAAGMSFYDKSAPVETLDEALRLLGEWEWIMTVPLAVHPEFREQIWSAVEERAREVPEHSRNGWTHSVNRWREVCGPTPLDETAPE